MLDYGVLTLDLFEDITYMHHIVFLKKDSEF